APSGPAHGDLYALCEREGCALGAGGAGEHGCCYLYLQAPAYDTRCARLGKHDLRIPQSQRCPCHRQWCPQCHAAEVYHGKSILRSGYSTGFEEDEVQSACLIVNSCQLFVVSCKTHQSPTTS